MMRDLLIWQASTDSDQKAAGVMEQAHADRPQHIYTPGRAQACEGDGRVGQARSSCEVALPILLGPMPSHCHRPPQLQL